MIEIDGSEKSGSGTILRCAVSLATLLNEDLHITNIRARRKPKPGLRPQHLKSVEACAQLCNGKVEGAKVGAMEILYQPGKKIKGGYYRWDIGTAGSTTMLAMTSLPLLCFADSSSTLRIEGGLFQDFAPSAYHIQYVLLPTLERMGIHGSLEIIRPGYVPEGRGVIEVSVEPVNKIKSLRLEEQGEIKIVEGVALSSHLKEQKVSERMVKACERLLQQNGYGVKIREIYDTTAQQKGAALAVWTADSCRLGADCAGKIGRSSERIGRYVAQNLLEDIRTGATVDRHLADQLIIYGALAEGETLYRIPRLTEHVETNLWLVEKILGAKTKLEENWIKINGAGYTSQ